MNFLLWMLEGGGSVAEHLLIQQLLATSFEKTFACAFYWFSVCRAELCALSLCCRSTTCVWPQPSCTTRSPGSTCSTTSYILLSPLQPFKSSCEEQTLCDPDSEQQLWPDRHRSDLTLCLISSHGDMLSVFVWYLSDEFSELF